MVIVVALGGNALLERGQRPDASVQQENVERAVRALAPLAAQATLVVTHGNGPQIGLLAAESAADPALTRPYPLASIGAETQGLMGFWLAQALRAALPGRPVAAVVTQTVVALDDEAWKRPTKPIGPVYPAGPADDLATTRGWHFVPEGSGYRRVVPSPEPLRVVELDVIELLVRAGTIVVCGGGGGVPVVPLGDGRFVGTEAVVDKDRTSAVIAEAVGADLLLLLTDVAGVERDHGTPQASVIRAASVDELREGRYPEGSMGPKVEAACRFAARTGRRAVIASLDDAVAAAAGEAGTVVCPVQLR